MKLTKKDIGHWFITRGNYYAFIQGAKRTYNGRISPKPYPYWGFYYNEEWSNKIIPDKTWARDGSFDLGLELSPDLIRKLDALEVELLGLNDVKEH